VRAGRTAILLFILGRTLSTCRSLDMRRLGSIRRAVLRSTARLARDFKMFHAEHSVMAATGIRLCHDR
jgi:hypothetical protein